MLLLFLNSDPFQNAPCNLSSSQPSALLLTYLISIPSPQRHFSSSGGPVTVPNFQHIFLHATLVTKITQNLCREEYPQAKGHAAPSKGPFSLPSREDKLSGQAL